MPKKKYSNELKFKIFEKYLKETSVKVNYEDTYSYNCGRFAWIETINDLCLYEKICGLSDNDKELLSLLVEYGFSKREIAKIRGVSEQAIGQKLKRLKNFLIKV